MCNIRMLILYMFFSFGLHKIILYFNFIEPMLKKLDNITTLYYDKLEWSTLYTFNLHYYQSTVLLTDYNSSILEVNIKLHKLQDG